MAIRQRHIPAGINSLGEAIRFLREEQGLTLRALAQKVQVSAPFLSDLEHDRRQTNQIDALAEALNVPVVELKALDTRTPPDLEKWLQQNPRLINLLKDLQNSGRPVPLEAFRAAVRRNQ
jgi:transcriptional regulator with XRE-family HTH domain